MIPLNLYRYLPETYNTGSYEDPDPDCRYTSYKIFIIISRLYPLIYKLLNKRNKTFVNSSAMNHHLAKLYNIEIRGRYINRRIEEYLYIYEMIPAQPGDINQVKEREISLTDNEKK